MTQFETHGMVVGQFAVAALYERRPAVTDRRYKGQIGPLPTVYLAMESANA